MPFFGTSINRLEYLAISSSHDGISSFWSVLGFFLFLCFALGQLCAMWKPIAGALGSYTSSSSSGSSSSTTVLLTCLTGLLLGIPLVTESGISIIHYLDMVLGGAFFVLILWTGQIFAIFLVRGRPYSGDTLVNDMRLTQTLSAFVALSWNLLLPIGLLTLCVLEYKMSLSRDFYHWHSTLALYYWPMWARKSASFIQLSILLIVPLTVVIQIYRYLSRGPQDILDVSVGPLVEWGARKSFSFCFLLFPNQRLQLLYRPSISSSPTAQRYPQPRIDRPTSHNGNIRHNVGDLTTVTTTTIPLDVGVGPSIHDDAPPKYTPPPSYTTATGARIAKMLRNSIRRSVRR